MSFRFLAWRRSLLLVLPVLAACSSSSATTETLTPRAESSSASSSAATSSRRGSATTPSHSATSSARSATTPGSGGTSSGAVTPSSSPETSSSSSSPETSSSSSSPETSSSSTGTGSASSVSTTAAGSSSSYECCDSIFPLPATVTVLSAATGSPVTNAVFSTSPDVTLDSEGSSGGRLDGVYTFNLGYGQSYAATLAVSAPGFASQNVSILGGFMSGCEPHPVCGLGSQTPTNATARLRASGPPDGGLAGAPDATGD